MNITVSFSILNSPFSIKKPLTNGKRLLISCLVQKILQLLGARRMTQLTQRLCLDLADTLTSYVEFLADLLEGAGMAVLDTEAQAQMLYDLGLFKGTDKGFALEKSMTRAEASVMLTRLLGAEKTALAGNWKHPFTDVPQWADKYVGWLYQNGLTKGVSATLYGSQRNVTCGQYCIFLTRAHLDADSYQGTAFVDNDEVRQTDEEGFIRGDAV